MNFDGHAVGHRETTDGIFIEWIRRGFVGIMSEDTTLIGRLKRIGDLFGEKKISRWLNIGIFI